MYELQTWLGTPCIYVLDCSAAGLIINNFKAMMEQRQQQLALQQQQAAAAGLLGSAAAGVGLPDPMREIIVLGACGGNELLPQVRAYPLAFVATDTAATRDSSSFCTVGRCVIWTCHLVTKLAAWCHVWVLLLPIRCRCVSDV